MRSSTYSLFYSTIFLHFMPLSSPMSVFCLETISPVPSLLHSDCSIVRLWGTIWHWKLSRNDLSNTPNELTVNRYFLSNQLFPVWRANLQVLVTSKTLSASSSTSCWAGIMSFLMYFWCGDEPTDSIREMSPAAEWLPISHRIDGLMKNSPLLFKSSLGSG